MSPTLGFYGNARDDIKERLLPVFPNDAELEGWLARCYEEVGEYKMARKYYALSVKHAPTVVETYGRLADLLRRHSLEILEGKETRADALKEADQAMDDLVRANEGSYRAYLMRAAYRRATATSDTERADAVRDERRARELGGNAVEVLVAIADTACEQAEKARQSGDVAGARAAIDAARGSLRQGCERSPKEWQLYLALARLETSDGKIDAAIAALTDGLAQSPDQVRLQWELAELHARAGDADKLTPILERLTHAGVGDAERTFLSAMLDLKLGDLKAARVKLEKSAPALVGRADSAGISLAARLAPQANLMLAYCYDQVSDFDRALAVYNRVLTRDPRSVPGRRGVAAAQRALGHTQEALDQYRTLMRESDPVIAGGAAIEVARLLFARNLAREKNSRDWAEVEQILNDAESAYTSPRSGPPRPVPSVTTLLRVEVLVASGKSDAALKLLQERFPNPATRPAEAWVALASFEERKSSVDAALRVLDEASRYVPDVVELRLARGMFLARAKRTESGVALARLADKREQFDAEQRRNLLNGLAAIAAGSGDVAVAERLWEQLVKEWPDDVLTRASLFDLAIRTGSAEAIQSRVEQLRAAEGEDGVLWRYASAFSLIKRYQGGDKSANLAEARSLLAAIAARRSNWSSATKCEARLDDLQGQPDKALAGYLKVLQSGDRDPLAFARALELLYERRRYNEAYDLMRTLPESDRASPELKRFGAELALQVRDTRAALTNAEAVVAAGSNDFRDYMRLGRAQLASLANDKAIASFERARELAPKEADTWVALVQVLASTGKKDRALAETQAAEKRLTGGDSVLALAQCFETAGKSDRAKELYEAAAKVVPTSANLLQGVANYYVRTGQFATAEPMLRRLVRDYGTQTPDMARWARRNLAVILAIQGGDARTTEALSILESDGTTSGNVDAVGTDRTKATLLAIQKTRKSRRDALGILEGLIDGRTATPEDHFLAAQLHESLDDWPRARRRYLGLIDLPGGMDSSTRIVVAARSLLRHGEPNEARPFIRKIDDLDAKSFAAREMKARLLRAENKPVEAVALLKAVAQSDGVNPMAVAGLLNEFKEYAAAEELLRHSVDKSHQTIDSLLLAEFLIERKRFADALEVCDRLWSVVKPAELIALADACLVALAQMPPDSPQADRVEKRLMEQAAKFEDRIDLRVALATVQNCRERYNEAIQTYQAVIQKDPRQIVALNNVAWLLALTRRPDESLAYIRRATDILGQDPRLLDTRGVALLATGKIEFVQQAVKDLEFVVSEMRSASGYFHLAQAYTAAGRKADAAKAWRRAKEMELDKGSLHPLERPAYEQMERDFR
ncbi:MAG: tetratricopeptide repeat protein [Gemmataceae bacterium]